MLNNQDFTVNRQNFLGGSDIAAILGLSPFRTPVEVWMEKTGKSKNQLNSLPLRFGSFAESFIASEYAKATGFTTLGQDTAIVHPHHDFLRAHIDRLVITKEAPSQANDLKEDSLEDIFPVSARDNKSTLEDKQPKRGLLADRLLECKTANPFYQQEWGDTGTDQVPLHYLCQCAWYLALTEMQQIDLAVLFGNSDFRIYHIERDIELEITLLEQAIHFWEQYVLLDKPPAAKNQEDYKQLFSKECPNQSIEASQTTIQLLSSYPELLSQAQAIESQIDEVKQAVMGEMQHADILLYQGRTLATWKSPKPSQRFDQKTFEKNYPKLYQEYQIFTPNTRRLLIK